MHSKNNGQSDGWTTMEPMERIHGLTEAMESHYQWLWVINRALVCNLPPSSDELHCGFGTWIEWFDDPGFDAIRRRHERMHRLADDLLAQVRRGATVDAEQFDAFSRERQRFEEAISQVERSWWSEICLIDSLTGLRNRHGMMNDLRDEQQRSLRERSPCAVAMMDVDHFKGINDRFGHLAGDGLLRAITRLLQRRMRPYDRLYRYGGEEFLLCLPDTSMRQAEHIVERLRSEIANTPFVLEGHSVTATVSFGVAPLVHEGHPDRSIERADKALYAAKNGGRNRVMVTPHQAPVLGGELPV